MLLAHSILLMILPVFGSPNFGSWFKGTGTAATMVKHSDDLAGRLIVALEEVQRPEHSVQGALAVLDSFKSLPSCNRLAWSGLITSCSGLDSQPSDHADAHDSEVSLENVRSIFATRLAVCELAAVNTEVVPSACASFLTSTVFGESTEIRSKRRLQVHDQLHFPHNVRSSYTRSEHEACLKALHADPRAWTSYSNAKQNSLNICEVSKKSVDNDALVDLHRSMLEVAKKSEQINTHNVIGMEALSNEITGLVDMLRHAIRAHTDHHSHIVTKMETELEPLLTNIRNADSEINSVYTYVRRTSGEMETIGQLYREQHHAWHASTQKLMASFVETFEMQKRAAAESQQQTKDFLEHFSIQLTAPVQALVADTQAIGLTVTEFAPVIANLVETASEMQHAITTVGNTVDTLNDDLQEARAQLKALMVSEEMAYNTTINRFGQAHFNNRYFIASSFSALLWWCTGALWSWFYRLPLAFVIGGQFCFFALVALVCTIASRKLAAMPFSIITAPARQLWSAIRTAPWPVPVVSLHLSIYFACLEPPTELIARWLDLYFYQSDLFLVLGVSIPILSYTGTRLYKTIGHSADVSTLEKSQY